MSNGLSLLFSMILFRIFMHCTRMEMFFFFTFWQAIRDLEKVSKKKKNCVVKYTNTRFIKISSKSKVRCLRLFARIFQFSLQRFRIKHLEMFNTSSSSPSTAAATATADVATQCIEMTTSKTTIQIVRCKYASATNIVLISYENCEYTTFWFKSWMCAHNAHTYNKLKYI